MESTLDLSSKIEKIDTITCSFRLTLNEVPGVVLETYFVYVQCESKTYVKLLSAKNRYKKFEKKEASLLFNSSSH